MTIQDPHQSAAAAAVPVIPDSAPFSMEQRAWLNGFFAGLLSLEPKAGVSPMTGELPGAAANALAGDDGDAPWHDAAMPMEERMQLAEGRPLKRRLFAAMAQQDCGQCGYLCETYSAAIAAGTEGKLNLCVPGGKETSRMLKRLLEEAPAPAVHAVEAREAAPAAKAEPGCSRDAPVTAIFRSAAPLSGAGSDKDTRHVVIDISGSGIAYAPGDSFGVFPSNDPDLVDAVIAAMRAPADLPIGAKTFREMLIEDYALGSAPDMLFELISYLTSGAKRRKAKLLAKGEDPDGDAASFDVLAALESFGPIHPDPEAFLESLEPLQPRLYSISSAPLKTPGEIHLTVDAVRYEVTGRKRLGVASTFFADRLSAGTPIKVYLQKAHGFAMPADLAKPIVMVGPGTGIAPFRSFLWQRHAMGASGKAWLFFGHQHEAADFFYREELEVLRAAGTLANLSTAWSRDGRQKVYVQDRMREAGAELWSWLEAGAHFYVCGDAKRMAKDVEAALGAIAVAHGGKSETAAKDFIAALKASGRYQADVY
jgi:sulfite reductase (NADPH) flavoprotein alpha-component